MKLQLAPDQGEASNGGFGGPGLPMNSIHPTRLNGKKPTRNSLG